MGDLGRQLERLPDVNPDEYETNDAVFGIYLNAPIIDKLEKRVFLLALQTPLTNANRNG